LSPRLRRIFVLSVFALLLVSACTRDKGSGAASSVAAPIAAKPMAPAAIKVGSYNMAMFGRTKAARPGTMAVLAKIAAGFDLLAMQEVGSNGSTADDEACVKVMDAFAAEVDKAAGGDYYAYVRGDQYAFLFRKDRLELKSSKLYDGAQTFTYEPLVAYFQVLGRPLDFAAITAHTRPSLAKSEIPALAAAMDETAAALGEPDVLCAGDFNADGSYYAEGEGSSLAGFPSSRYASVIPNDADTTVASASLAYDRIELTSSMAGDWDGSWGILRPAEAYDLSSCEGSESSAGTERALSDHYPVWAELSTTADRD
jgi:endonuclease/exonuclease/phosphatase family metal-dependent hydrolase